MGNFIPFNNQETIMATIKDIAAKLGISVSAVSKGLNGAEDISEELRQQVLDTAIEMGYTPKRIRKESLRKLCVLVKNMDYCSNFAFHKYHINHS